MELDQLALWQRCLLLALWCAPGLLSLLISSRLPFKKRTGFLSLAVALGVGAVAVLDWLAGSWGLSGSAYILLGWLNVTSVFIWVCAFFARTGAVVPTRNYYQGHNRLVELSPLFIGSVLGFSVVAALYPSASQYLFAVALHMAVASAISGSRAAVEAPPHVRESVASVADKVGLKLAGVYVLEDDEIGTSLSADYLILSSGAVEKLSKAELAFLVAHDLEQTRIAREQSWRSKVPLFPVAVVFGLLGGLIIVNANWYWLVVFGLAIVVGLWMAIRLDRKAGARYAKADELALMHVPGLDAALSCIQKADYRAQCSEDPTLSDEFRSRIHALRQSHQKTFAGSEMS